MSPRLAKDKQWTTDLDIQLINGVHDHAAIWDHASTDYHNPLAKYMSWQEIETSMGIECGVVKKRWTTLRDSFTKAFRRLQAAKRSGAGSRKVKYKYYYDMLFLAPTLRQTIELNSPSDPDDEEISDPDSPLTILYPDQSNEDPNSNCVKSENESTANIEQESQSSTSSPPASRSPSVTPNQRPQRTKKEPPSVTPPEAPPYKKRGRPPLNARTPVTASTPIKPTMKEVLAKATANSNLASTSKQPPLSKEDALCEAAGQLVAASLKDLPKSAVKKKIAQIMNMLASSDS